MDGSTTVQCSISRTFEVYRFGEWARYSAEELPEIADLLVKNRLTDADWQRVHAALAARASVEPGTGAADR